MTFRTSAVSPSLRSRSRFPLERAALVAVLATLTACAQTPAAPQAAQAAAPVATTSPAPAPAAATAAPASAAAAAAAATPAAPLPIAAGLSPSEEQIEPHQYANNPKVDAFINDVAARDGFDPAALHALFASANYSATAVKLVKPAASPTVKSWRRYQSNFLEPIRINAGVKFWRDNQATLQRAADEFGVPPEVIVGIIGVETIYGRYMGSFPTLDALTTLAFDYPDTPNRDDRQATFRKNLEDFLVWTRDSRIDPTSVKGSYTGAIGIPQFLPSSIRSYAVDYEGTGQINLRTSVKDAIGSVANYLKQHGWEPGRPVVWDISPDAGSQGVAQAAADGKPEPHMALSQLTQAGLVLDAPAVNAAAEANTQVTVVDLPTPGRPTEYKLGLKNFYVLTRYNRSFFYALSVYQLGERVKQKMQDGQ